MPEKKVKRKVRDAMTLEQKKYIKDSKRLYDSIKGKKVHCKIIGVDVFFTALGWEHLAHNNRNFQDMYRRIQLLSYVESVVQNASEVKTSTTMKDCFILSGVRRFFIKRARVYEKKNVKVNVIKEKSGRYVFLSIC